MKSFKEWCAHKYGIDEFVEGKINSSIFIVTDDIPIGMQAIRLWPSDGSSYQILKEKLKINNKVVLNGFISPSKNLIDSKRHPDYYEYKTPAPIYFRLSDETKFKARFEVEFLKKHKLEKEMSLDPFTMTQTFLGQPIHLEALYEEYNEELLIERKQNPLTLEQLTEWEKKVSALIEVIKNKPQLKQYLAKAHHLSKDYSNDPIIDNRIYEACSGYSLSLQLYAELHRELLSENEYGALQHVIEALGRGNRQSLKTDVNFMYYLVHELGRRTVNAEGGCIPAEKQVMVEWTSPITKKSSQIFNPIKKRAVYSELEKKISENIENLLNGNDKVDWLGAAEGKPPYKMRRFLPDGMMRSETNEIILQGGRMITHSAILGIIKVGITKDGETSNDPQEIHHFDYYHVQTNLGAECNERIDDLCTGTYISKLGPTRLESDFNIPISIDPKKDPKAYQVAMETTIRELIKTERQLCFYRQPITGPNEEEASPCYSPEAIEWDKLNTRLNWLKGRPIPQDKTISYYSIDSNGTSTKSFMKNQVNYAQVGGSCTIFSLKQLVNSILGTYFTTLHSSFLQNNDSATQVKSLEELLKNIKERKSIAKPTAIFEQKQTLLSAQSFDHRFFTQSKVDTSSLRKSDLMDNMHFTRM